MAKTKEGFKLTKEEASEKLAGMTYRRLYDINKELPEEKKIFVTDENGKIDSVDFVRRWTVYNMMKVMDKSRDLDGVKAEHETVKMEKTMLEVAKMRGELVDVRDIIYLWGNIANSVMTNMLHLPSKIAPMIVGMSSQNKITEIIDKEIRTALEAIADTPLPEYAEKEREE